MKTLTINAGVIRSTQVKILNSLLDAPLCKLSVFLNTNFNRLFKLTSEESNQFNLAWTLLKDEGVVYSRRHEIGINAESLVKANRFVRFLKEYLADQKSQEASRCLM